MTALTLGVAVGFLLPARAEPGDHAQLLTTNLHLPDAQTSRQEAEERAPYHVREPKKIPPGAELINVVYLDDQEEGVPRAFSVDMWWLLDSGDRLHLWQTNSSTLDASGQNPASPAVGSPEAVNGQMWRRVHFQWGSSSRIALSFRFDDGVTLSLDGPLDRNTMREIAASIE